MQIRAQRRFAGEILLIFCHVKQKLVPAGFLLAVVYPC